MKPAAFALSIFFFSVLLFASGNLARNTPEEYWKEVMKDQPMPEAIKGIVANDGSSAIKNLVRDFDVTPNAIIYHGRNSGEAMKKMDEGPN